MIASTASSALCGACGDVIPESADQCPGVRRRARARAILLLRVADQAGGPRRDFVLALFRVVVLEPIPSRSPQRRTLGHAAEDYFFRTLLLLDAREVKEDAAKHGVTCRYSPALLTALFLAAGIAARMLPASAGLLVTLLGPIPLLPVQAAINRVNAATSGGPPRAWSWWEIVLATVLGLFCCSS